MLKFYRRFVVVIIIPIIAAAFPFFVFASNIDTKAYDWYFKAESENKQPTLIPEADFINDYDIISMGDPDQKTLYLTFDAGYDNGFHTQILDTLKQKNVTAAFFVDGNFAERNGCGRNGAADDGNGRFRRNVRSFLGRRVQGG